jgi:hypothetical protein
MTQTARARDALKPHCCPSVLPLESGVAEHGALNAAHAPPSGNDVHTWLRPVGLENVVHDASAAPEHATPSHAATQRFVPSHAFAAAEQPSRQLRTQFVPHAYLPPEHSHTPAAPQVAPEAASQVPQLPARATPQRSFATGSPQFLATAVQAAVTTSASERESLHSHLLVAALQKFFVVEVWSHPPPKLPQGTV